MKVNMELGALIHCLTCSGLELRAYRTYDPGMKIREIGRSAGGAGAVCLCAGGERPEDGGCVIFAPELRPGDERYAAAFSIRTELAPEALYLKILECAGEYLCWSIEVERLLGEPDAVQRIVSLSEPYFPFPLAVFNSVGDLVAWTERIQTSYPPFAIILRERHMPSFIINDMSLLDASVSQGRQSQGIVVDKARQGDGSVNIYRTCFLFGRVVYRSCFFCHTARPSPEFQWFAERFFRQIDRYVERNQSRFRADAESEAYLLRTLVRGSYADKDYLIQNLSYYDMPQRGNFLLVNVLLGDVEFSRRDIVLQSMRAIGELRCFHYKAGVMALLDLRAQGKEAEKRLTYYLENLEVLLNEYEAIAAVSNSFEDIFSMLNAYMQTEKTLELVKRLDPIFPKSAFLQGKSRIIHYKEVFAYHLLYDIGDWAVRENPVAVALLRHIQQSRLSREEILKTLYVHISNGCRHNVTAQLLSLHRNTVANRIEQLEQELGISLDNFEDCINVVLAIKAIECGHTG